MSSVQSRTSSFSAAIHTTAYGQTARWPTREPPARDNRRMNATGRLCIGVRALRDDHSAHANINRMRCLGGPSRGNGGSTSPEQIEMSLENVTYGQNRLQVIDL